MLRRAGRRLRAPSPLLAQQTASPDARRQLS